MKANIQISFLIILILTVIGCQNDEKKEPQLIKKDFGKWKNVSDSLGVELLLNKFKTWDGLLKRVERIACNDSVPKITLKSDNEIKTIYFHEPCWKHFACILINQRNTIEIHNDTINKNNENFYPLDSLETVLKRDIENNGKNPRLSDNPKKLVIWISYDKDGFKNLLKTLDKLTKAYERITNKTDINIWLHEKIDIIPPPPLPKEIEEVE